MPKRDNTFLYLKYLPKQRGGRLEDLSTFKTVCNPKDAHARLQGIETLKSPDDSDSYVQVIKSIITDHRDTPFIVKIQPPGLQFQKEIRAQELLQGQNNVVRFICHFSCPFNLVEWSSPVKTPRAFCNPEDGKGLNIILMEYISHDLANFLEEGEYGPDILESIIKQVGFSLMEIHFNRGISHNDVNRGNILLDIDKPKTIEYKIGALKASIDTLGHECVWLDFERSTNLPNKKNKTAIIFAVNEISLAYYYMSLWSKQFKKVIEDLSTAVSDAKTIRSIFHLIRDFSLVAAAPNKIAPPTPSKV